MNKKYDFLIDTHCHLDFDDYSVDLSEVINRAYLNKVNYLITISTRVHNFHKLKAIIDKYDNIYTTIGTHPLNTDEEFGTYDQQDILSISKEPKVVGIGECGLDYHYGKDSKDEQKKSFITQINVARDTNLPLIIHARDADIDMITILEDEFKKGSFKAILHCFSSGRDLAQCGLDLGFYISFSGIVTFKSAKTIQNIAKIVPSDKILVETDAPYLAPTPLRGTVNEPKNCYYTARFLSELRECDYDEKCNGSY